MGSTQRLDSMLCVVVGDSGVGKSTLVNLWTGRTLQPAAPTPSRLPTLLARARSSSAASKAPSCTVASLPFTARMTPQEPEQEVLMTFLDVNGLPTDNADTLNRIKGASAIVLVYDVKQKSSLVKVLEWWRFYRGIIFSDPLIYLIGNKDDGKASKKQVIAKKARKICQNLGIFFYQETSCLQDRYRTVEVLRGNFLEEAYRHHHGIVCGEPVPFLPSVDVSIPSKRFG